MVSADFLQLAESIIEISNDIIIHVPEGRDIKEDGETTSTNI